MVGQILDGKHIAAGLRSTLALKINDRIQQGHRPPALAVILVGEDPASAVYVKNKRAACAEVGMTSHYFHLETSVSQEALITLITKLNKDETIDGILLQLPLPNHIQTDKVLENINPHKDVDGFHPYNLGRLAQRRPLLRPCTPFGVVKLLQSTQTPLAGAHAVVIGASNIVGLPMMLELLMLACTVTICHRHTTDLPSMVKQADIVISAAGVPQLIKGDWIKQNAIVIDVGITRLADGNLTGDIEFDVAKNKASWITPVPGGVGPMTVAMLLTNTLQANLANQ
jgi:methylenetetrahydrofolate dehydrogenase (NADP+)/methenyltetrahydrofolate cyclohydrolase